MARAAGSIGLFCKQLLCFLARDHGQLVAADGDAYGLIDLDLALHRRRAVDPRRFPAGQVAYQPAAFRPAQGRVAAANALPGEPEVGLGRRADHEEARALADAHQSARFFPAAFMLKH
jgi:hypothetical protein